MYDVFIYTDHRQPMISISSLIESPFLMIFMEYEINNAFEIIILFYFEQKSEIKLVYLNCCLLLSRLYV